MKRASTRLLALVALAASGCIKAPEKLDLEGYLGRFDDASEGGNDISAPDIRDPDATVTGDIGGTDGPDATDGDVVDTDTDTETDTGPTCTPHPLGMDFCNGLDDDCDGQTDEETHPPKVTVDFKQASGWTRSSPRGTVAHVSGPVGFRGLADVGSVVWAHVRPWTGDVEFEANVLLSSVGNGAEWYLGAFDGETPDGTGRTGVSIIRKGQGLLTVRAIVNDAIVGETDVQPGSFLSVLFRLTTGTERVIVRLQKGDGSAVAEVEATSVKEVPHVTGFEIAALGGPVLGSVARFDVRGTPDCKAETVPACGDCAAAEPCTVAVCNPLIGCEIKPLACGLSTECSDAPACDPLTNTCGLPTPKNDGGACEVDEHCTSGAVCAAGACVGGEARSCAPAAACQEDAGACQNYLGCVYASKDEGLACDDGTLCTSGDHCGDGQCVGTAVVCPSNGPCESASTCDAITGTCSVVSPLGDGTTCEDNNACTETSSCTAGICSGATKSCDDAIPCTLDLCSPTTGECSHAGDLSCLVTTAALSGPAAVLTLVSGGVVAVGASGVASVAADGTVAWTAAGVTDVTAPGAALSPDGATLYVGDATGGAPRLAALGLDGGVRWSFPVPGTCDGTPSPCRIVATPTASADGAIYVSTPTGLHAVTVTDDGSGPVPALAWTTGAHVGAGSSVVRSSNGYLYVGQGGATPGVLSVSTAGEAHWLWAAPAPITVTPVVVGPSLIVAAGSVLTGIRDNGSAPEVVFSFTSTDGTITTEPVISGDGHVVAAAGKSVWRLAPEACAGDPAKCVEWTFTAPSAVGAGLALLADGTLIVPTHDSISIVNTADASVLWSLPLTGLSPTVPVITDGRLTFGTADGKVHAAPFAAGVGLLPSPWPVFGRTQSRNTIE